jgi:predicted nucleic acid-binding protein
LTLVDSSVWIALLRGHKTPATAKLSALTANDILVGDIIILEVLQGASSDNHAAWLEQRLRVFQTVTLLNDQLAARAAQNYRLLRAMGITIRKTPDLIIGTYCIAHGHSLLHNDRDFEPMAAHLGLMVA